MPTAQPRTEAQRSEWGASVSQEVTKPEFGAACLAPEPQRAVPLPPTLGGRACPGRACRSLLGPFQWVSPGCQLHSGWWDGMRARVSGSCHPNTEI